MLKIKINSSKDNKMCLNDDRSGEKGLIIMCEMF